MTNDVKVKWSVIEMKVWIDNDQIWENLKFKLKNLYLPIKGNH